MAKMCSDLLNFSQWALNTIHMQPCKMEYLIQPVHWQVPHNCSICNRRLLRFYIVSTLLENRTKLLGHPVVYIAKQFGDPRGWRGLIELCRENFQLGRFQRKKFISGFICPQPPFFPIMCQSEDLSYKLEPNKSACFSRKTLECVKVFILTHKAPQKLFTSPLCASKLHTYSFKI